MRTQSRLLAVQRQPLPTEVPVNPQGKFLNVSEYFGENVFNYELSKNLTQAQKKELEQVMAGKATLEKELAKSYANAVLEWALDRGVTHFCHWFQPLTGATAEKHDAFLSYDKERAVEKLSASQLMQGEPDASSFPNGGSRSTFEARGYTSWDITSPIFIKEGTNGATLCIPTAFVSYHGDALDIKTPLLRSVTTLSETAAEFSRLTGATNVKKVNVTCGCEQEYFLVDKAFYFDRPDLVMTGRTVIGSLTAKNQQLDDHYFGAIPPRALAFMQDLEVELYRLGIPAKTRHNEVAPGQFEIAPIFKDANIAADQNQLVMTTIREIALRHDFVALLHEKPFAGINGSGKHVNWSMGDDEGRNLLEPGANPHENNKFLAVVAMTCEALKRHGDVLRMAIASHGNDHRLGANEAPPSIISAFLGDTLTNIFESLISDKSYKPEGNVVLDLGADQLANLLKDNTDRNRTSPFAFTGNKFEFRAVGSSAAIGWPVSILNAAVNEVMSEVNVKLKAEVESGKSVDDTLLTIATDLYKSSQNVVFGGDGYSDEWVKEAQSRGLSNLRTTADALSVLKDETKTKFLTESGIYRSSELKTRYNVLVERYITHREIEFNVQTEMVEQNIIPAVVSYKRELTDVVKTQKEIGILQTLRLKFLKSLSTLTDDLYTRLETLKTSGKNIHDLDEEAKALKIASELFPLSEQINDICSELEDKIPAKYWNIPTFYDMLFIR
jgi:glutamine synthetase